jgi:2-amino-4-hydroxy-6-hydroxymethyldihydropteridine diphosphokinase
VNLREPVQALVAIGANLGDPLRAVQDAIQSLGQLPLSQLRDVSSFYRTAPVASHGPDYINAAVTLDTRLTAPALLTHLQRLEMAAGRERPYTNAPRTLDLDVVFFGAGSIDSPRLTVPHPRWQERAFVLLPVQELAPERVSPALLAAVSSQRIERLV